MNNNLNATKVKSFIEGGVLFFNYINLEIDYKPMIRMKLMHIIEQIGIKVAIVNENNREGPLKRGISYIRQNLKEKNINVTNTEIKVFLILPVKYGRMKISKQSHQILEEMVIIIKKHNEVFEYCRVLFKDCDVCICQQNFAKEIIFLLNMHDQHQDNSPEYQKLLDNLNINTSCYEE